RPRPCCDRASTGAPPPGVGPSERFVRAMPSGRLSKTPLNRVRSPLLTPTLSCAPGWRGPPSPRWRLSPDARSKPSIAAGPAPSARWGSTPPEGGELMVPVVAALPAHLRCYFVEVAAWRDTALAARRSPDLAPA